MSDSVKRDWYQRLIRFDIGFHVTQIFLCTYVIRSFVIYRFCAVMLPFVYAYFYLGRTLFAVVKRKRSLLLHILHSKEI